jgi:DHA1 family bicyclomycin/chloramphenicol resistance-like MFS transporter
MAQSEPAPRSERGSLGRLLILGSLVGLGPLAVDTYLPGLPALTHGLHASEAYGQLTLTACLLGLGIGQLLVGPLSDARGRRAPLLVGLLAFSAASMACAIAPSIGALVALRFVEGLTGAAGLVIAPAIVRDSYSGRSAATRFSVLQSVTGVAPVIAPLAGSALLRVTTWRGIYVALAAFGVLLYAVVLIALDETHPRSGRQSAALRSVLKSFSTLWHDRHFVALAGAFGLTFASLFAYISGSSFVLEDIYRLSPQLYAVVFAANAAGLVLAARAGAKFVGRFGPARLLRWALCVAAVASLGLLAAGAAHAPLALVLICMFTLVSSVGVIAPNATALALAEQGARAGSASAQLGAGQFVLGAAVAPLVGVAGSHTMLPLGIVIALCSCTALVLYEWGSAVGRPRLQQAN